MARSWQCPRCGLRNTPQSRSCAACFKSRYPSNLKHGNRSRNYTKPEKRVISDVTSTSSKSIRPYHNNSFAALKSTASRPKPSSFAELPLKPKKISDIINNKTIDLLSGYIRSELDEYLYPESDLILLINLYLSDGALFRCYSQQNQWIMNNGIKLISSIGGYSINGKGIAIIGFNINARNRHLLYEWTVNIRTFNPPDSFIGIIANKKGNFAQYDDDDDDNEYKGYDTSFDYAQSQFCNGIGGERHRVYRMGKLDRKIKYKSGWHCNNVSHWNDNYDIVKCRYDGRYRQLSFTKFIRNTNKFKLICTIQLPAQLPGGVHSWCPAIYLGHISDCCTVHY